VAEDYPLPNVRPPFPLGFIALFVVLPLPYGATRRLLAAPRIIKHGDKITTKSI